MEREKEGETDNKQATDVKVMLVVYYCWKQGVHYSTMCAHTTSTLVALLWSQYEIHITLHTA